LEALIKRLQPLRHLEQLLIAKLVPPHEDEAISLPSSTNSLSDTHSHQRTISYSGNTSDFDSSSFASPSKQASILDKMNNTNWRTQEIFVRPGVSLKGAFARSKLFNSPLLAETGRTEPGSSIDSEKTLARPLSAGALDSESATFDYAQGILNTHASDIRALWEDRAVREVLKKRKVKIEEGPGL
jgi:guanine nucleotide-binding protein subunit alpha